MRTAGMKHWPYTAADSKTASAAVASAAGSLAATATATASQDSALKRRMPGEQGAKPSWGRGGNDNGQVSSSLGEQHSQVSGVTKGATAVERSDILQPSVPEVEVMLEGTGVAMDLEPTQPEEVKKLERLCVA